MADELDPTYPNDDVRRGHDEPLGRSEEDIRDRANEDEEFEDIDEANEDEDELES
jgi:hypothetical protein